MRTMTFSCGKFRERLGISVVFEMLSLPIEGSLHPDLRNVALVELLGPELGV